jgi:hypothetical protein
MLREFASTRGGRYFVLRILNIGFQITRLPMHQWVAAMVNFFALVKGFAIWHLPFIRDNREEFHHLKPHVYVGRMPTGWPPIRRAKYLARREALAAINSRASYGCYPTKVAQYVRQARGEAQA